MNESDAPITEVQELAVANAMMTYWPNPVHKQELTDAGPGQWRPDKTLCPRMTIAERNALFEGSIPERPDDRTSPRFSVRRSIDGVEFYKAAFTQWVGDAAEFHGFPTKVVPTSVLRRFRDAGLITLHEYRAELREQR